MKKVLITGGTGTLGREIINQLTRNDFQISVLSSKDKPELPKTVEVLKGDLTDPASLPNAISEAEVILHCASNPMNPKVVDVTGTRNLIKAIKPNRLKHFIYISIVGVDQSDYPYYQAKYEVEKMIIASGLPYSILRATQFHDLVLHRLIVPADQSNNLQIVIPANMRFQSIDIREVTGKIKELLDHGPVNSTISIGGPEIFTLEEMTQIYLNVFGKQKKIKCNPEDQSFASFKSGINLCSDQRYGQITWEEYLQTVAS
ncbi:MAG: SDR family oxidoreductase [Mangrovibacterium sp.]